MTEHTQASRRPLIAIALSMVMMYIMSFGVNMRISAIVTDLNTSVSNRQSATVAASLDEGSYRREEDRNVLRLSMDTARPDAS